MHVVVAEAQRSAGRRWLAAHVRLEEQQRLAVQGRGIWEQLPSGRRCAKLRFRDAQGRQRVRYIDVDEQLAAAVSNALAQRQQSRRLRRETNRLRQRSGRIMRSVKRGLEPHLEQAGWRFHGQSLRRHANKGGSNHQLESPSLSGGLPPMTDMPESTPIDPTDSLSRRIGDDVRGWAQGQQTPLDRALGYAAAGLVELGLSIKQPINAHLATSDDPLNALDDFQPQSELALKLDRQFERNVQAIDRRAATAAKAKKSPNDTDERTPPDRQSPERPERAGPPIHSDA